MLKCLTELEPGKKCTVPAASALKKQDAQDWTTNSLDLFAGRVCSPSSDVHFLSLRDVCPRYEEAWKYSLDTSTNEGLHALRCLKCR